MLADYADRFGRFQRDGPSDAAPIPDSPAREGVVGTNDQRIRPVCVQETGYVKLEWQKTVVILA